MNSVLWRPSGALRGKDLNAFTLAAFAVMQGCAPSSISAAHPMPLRALRALTRPRTIQYWRDNGWLTEGNAAGTLCLTESGLRKVQDRLASRAGAQSVDLALVERWRLYILHGGEDAVTSE